MLIFERERERESARARARARASMSGGGADKETHNLKQAPGSKPSVQRLMWGSNSRTMSSCSELKSDA